MDTKLDLSFKEGDGHLIVRVAGEGTPDSVKLAIKDIAHAAQQRGFTRVLVDARNLSAPKTGFYRFLAGEEIARVWRDLKAAILYPEELIDKFTENTAVNRGAVVIVLSDLDEALRWLMDSSTKPSTATE
jgi:hypothetical protein